MGIGAKIKERRKELKISADELAQKLGKDRSTIYRYENGDIENLPLDILKPIADALDTTPAYLMSWDENKIETIHSAHNDSIDYLVRLEKKEIEVMIEMQKRWKSEFGNTELTAEETDRLYEYAKFIISQRKEG